MFARTGSPCQLLPASPLLGRPLWVKRDDLLHPYVSGNKFRKLKYALPSRGQQMLVSMGGIWSNHLHALAWAAHAMGSRAVALVRADPAMDSAMLQDCRQWGMALRTLNREEFRRLRTEPMRWRAWLTHEELDGDPLWLPEGGSAPAAVRGVAELVAELPIQPDGIACACGTGATAAGLLAGLQGRGKVLAVAVLKNADFLHDEIARLLDEAGYPPYRNYELLTDYHYGGYAKTTPDLLAFCRAFEQETRIPLEPVYTGKLFYALAELSRTGRLMEIENLVAVHSGGLQGRRGFVA